MRRAPEAPFSPRYASALALLVLAGCAIGGPPRLLASPIPAPLPTPEVTVQAPPPAAVPAVTPSTEQRPHAFANVDPVDDFVIGPPDFRPSCSRDLAAAGVVFRTAALPVHAPGGGSLVCGTTQAVRYLGSPAQIAHVPPPILTCTMALALAHFESILQEEARRTYGRGVKAIHNIGTYACREIAKSAHPSQHSYGNAIDLSAFVLDDGTVVSVLADFAPEVPAPTDPTARFLRRVARRAFDEDLFSSVLTPYYDSFHRNHFHLDLARYRADGTRWPGGS